ncbi:hypothetical protein GGR52DRAFT_103121 [Hypoxylon sp. FL1284]|nr:hypothetical protein GGR52DRAFT_103121 [Hypoxylon sp. FL1284]
MNGNCASLSASSGMAELVNPSTDLNSKNATKGRKRTSAAADLPETNHHGKHTKSDVPQEPEVIVIDDDDDDDNEDDEQHRQESKPRLTTPDLEFDFDRSQLRDPRPTPGRIARPRREEGELSEEFKQRFYIPEPEQPPGRLNAAKKEELYKQKSLVDPTDTFHHLHVCHHKGRAGSPACDTAGFQLDWEKVNDWMKPRAYSKKTIMNRTNRSLERGAREKREIYGIFFVDGEGLVSDESDVMAHLKDHVSKDLGIPWHQIGTVQLVEWEKRGFPKQKADEWWRKPNEVEKQRMARMQSGCVLRKDL